MDAERMPGRGKQRNFGSDRKTWDTSVKSLECPRMKEHGCMLTTEINCAVRIKEDMVHESWPGRGHQKSFQEVLGGEQCNIPKESQSCMLTSSYDRVRA